MAITGVSAISGEQIIAVGAVSAKAAATASYTLGGDSLQGLYDTVSNNSGSWSERKYSGGNMISIASDIISFSSQAGITDIVSATALPVNPVSAVLYLIPEA